MKFFHHHASWNARSGNYSNFVMIESQILAAYLTCCLRKPPVCGRLHEGRHAPLDLNLGRAVLLREGVPQPANATGAFN
jgi:hypothetical protein